MTVDPLQHKPRIAIYLDRIRPHHVTILEWFTSFSLHVLTGIAAVVAHYSLMWVLLQAGTQALIASSMGFTLGGITRYMLSFFTVFSPTASVPVTVIRFIVALAGQMTANVAILYIIVNAGMQVWTAQVITTISLTFANYIVYRLWVFK